MRDSVPPVVDLVLAGGGHSHVQVLRSLGMRPLPGARITVISREVFTPYSGMLPGHVAGCYAERDIHIDLGPLARFAGARLLAAEVTALDLDAGRIDLDGYPSVRFDVLSLNTGAVPAAVGECGIKVKPIGRFLPRWREVVEQVLPGQQITLVGGGAGGVELAMAMRRALGPEVHLTVVTDTLLAGHGERAAARLRAALHRHGIDVVEDFRVAQASNTANGQELVAEDGRRRHSNHLFWVTGVAAPGWLDRAGLSTDAGGFVRVDRHLRSLSHPQVFAAGDVAALEGQRRAKSGVYAVRQGPVLTANLRRSVLGGRLVRYRAQRRVLAIIGTADGRAVASRGTWSAAGRWVWWWA
ncbi:MAG: FAD-dependent oxidoreductase, partial [Gammaproteobacteria bacterium]|nr:FAD-dependent oxidoreductase [Gammaproteobacteria bacterium]